ncbi:MAG: ABC transporter ATP-binding protein [Planctomycetes bacterium]|nr:ABC transporter ATP-binding protein [Planctomycetota bacterium]
MTSASAPLLSVRNLSTHFRLRRGLWGGGREVRRAVDGVSFDLLPGRTLGLVGESGCGKTTLGRSILRLIPATAGEVLYEGRNILTLDRSATRQLRRKMQVVFQDPLGSLNPRMTIGSNVAEPLVVHRIGTRRERRTQVATMLERVGLSADAVQRYPHEFSGGQRQRICIARALITQPKLVILDEPTSALDVTIQARILALLDELRRDLQLSYLFISHNLAVVRNFCDEVAVMRAGRIVEHGPTKQVFADPQHDYTRALLSAVPSLESFRTQRQQRPGRTS